MGAGIPRPATKLFNRPIWGLLLQINRAPINVDKDYVQIEVLKAHQSKYDKSNDTQKSFLFSAGSTVAIKQEDGGLWRHRIIVEPSGCDHVGLSYTIQVTKMGMIITHNVKHIHTMPISAGQYNRSVRGYESHTNRNRWTIQAAGTELLVGIHGRQKPSTCGKGGRKDHTLPM